MNITISKISTKRVVVILAALTFLFLIGRWALSNNIAARWFATPTPSVSEDQPALQAITVMYSPRPAGERSVWEDQVCSGMTAEGCSLFKKLYAPAIWEAASPENKATVTFLQTADTFEDGSQIWKVNLAGLPVSTDIYIHVEADPASGKWLLKRVLFNQEAAKYAK